MVENTPNTETSIVGYAKDNSGEFKDNPVLTFPSLKTKKDYTSNKTKQRKCRTRRLMRNASAKRNRKKDWKK